MKIFFQGSNRVMLFNNVFISLLCTSYLFTGYLNYNVNDDVHHNETAKLIDNDMEVVSQSGNNNKVTTVKTTTLVVTKKRVKASNMKYTPAKYSEVTGSAIVDYSKKYLGLRYVSGGYSLETGTDCSGFTKLIYKEFGVNLLRTVRGQVKSGSYVKKSDLKKGDLVFYSKGGSTPTHVAIYIGNGQVIHASNPKDGVKISTVNMMTYITARRVINETANQIAADKVNDENKEDIINDVDNSSNVNIDTNTNIDVNNEQNIDNSNNLESVEQNTNTSGTTNNNSTNESSTIDNSVSTNN